MSQNTTRAILFSATFFVAAVVAVVFGYRYIISLGDTLHEQRVAINQYDAQQQFQLQLTRLIDETAVQRAEVTSRFLTETETIDFLTMIESTAGSFGLTIKTTGLDLIETDNDAFQDLSVRFVITGTQAATEQFLHVLETLPYHSQLDDLRQERGEVEWETSGHLFVTSRTQS